MKLYERGNQLRKQGVLTYTLWEAYPNIYHDGCYVLNISWSREHNGYCGSLMTYFYVDGNGPTLVEVVRDQLDKIDSRTYF